MREEVIPTRETKAARHCIESDCTDENDPAEYEYFEDFHL